MNGQIFRQLEQPQQPMVQVAAPMNDVQLVAMVAAQRHDLSAVEAVEWASEIVVESVAQNARLQQKIRERLQASIG